MIGYALPERAEHPVALALFVVAMGLHFVVNDSALREHHPRQYHRLGRWLLAGAVVAGWGIGVATRVSVTALAIPLAFVAGGIALNALKEELPPEREGRFWPFAAGAAVYAALLLGI